MRKHFVDGTLQECSRHSHRVGSFFGSWRAPSPRAETISPLVVGRGREHIDFGDDVVDDDDEESSATDDDEVSSATDDDDVSSATDDEEEEDEESVETETRCSILLLGKKLHEMNEAINTPSVLALIHNRTPQWLIKPKVETSDPSECQFTYNPPQRIEPGSIAPVAVQSFKSPSFFSKHDPRKYLGCTFLISYKVEVESKSKRYINTFVDFTDRNNVRHATLVSTGERLMLAAAEFRPRSATNFRPLVTFEGKGDTRFRGSMYEDTQAVAGLTVEQFLSELSGPNQSSHYRLGVAVNGILGECACEK